MRIAIVTTGDEILAGELVDTNAAWLSRELVVRNLPPVAHVSVGDDREALTALLRRLGATMDVVVCSGGLGPTSDDLTVECVAELLGAKVSLHAESLERGRAFFAQHGIEFTANNEKQAAVPEGSRVFVNPVGLAPGFACTLGTCECYFLPGVPRELKALAHQSVLPEIETRADPERPHRVQRVVKLVGVPESHLAGAVEPLVAAHPDVRVGYRAHYPEVWLKLGVTDPDGAAAARRADSLAAQVEAVFGHRAFGRDQATLESVLVDELAARTLRLAVADAVTGGELATRLAAVAQAVTAVVGVLTAPTVDALADLLPGAQVLAAGGEAQALALAEHLQRQTGAHLTVAVLPDEAAAEPGAVLIALNLSGQTRCKRRRFRPDPELLRAAAAGSALDLARRLLQNA